MTIKYYRKNVYGAVYMYVFEPKDKQHIALLTNQTTLSENAKRGLEYFGVKFEEVIAPLDKAVC